MMSTDRWSLAERDDVGTVIHGETRVELTAEELACLRILITARRIDAPDQQGYVRSVDLIPDRRRGSMSSSIQARALIRRLKLAFSSIGLDDAITEHDHFGYRLRVIPDEV